MGPLRASRVALESKRTVIDTGIVDNTSSYFSALLLQALQQQTASGISAMCIYTHVYMAVLITGANIRRTRPRCRFTASHYYLLTVH
jgi:hypothetical protein